MTQVRAVVTAWIEVEITNTPLIVMAPVGDKAIQADIKDWTEWALAQANMRVLAVYTPKLDAPDSAL
jgi:hypothetical protein